MGLALSLLNVETRAGIRPTQPLAVAIALVALLGLVGYAYGVPELYSIGRYRQMAMNTAALLFLLSLGLLLARPDEGWMRLALGHGVGGVTLRWLLPAVVATPILVGWVRLLGERAGLYGTEIGLSVFAISNVLILSALVVWSARRLEKVDAKRRASEARYRSLFESNLAGVY